MGQNGCPHNDCNPKKDKDVQRGYDEHQRETREKRDQEKGKVPPDQVKTSHDQYHSGEHPERNKKP